MTGACHHTELFSIKMGSHHGLLRGEGLGWLGTRDPPSPPMKLRITGVNHTSSYLLRWSIENSLPGVEAPK
jgi:hypothetical protein